MVGLLEHNKKGNEVNYQQRGPIHKELKQKVKNLEKELSLAKKEIKSLKRGLSIALIETINIKN